MLLGPYFPPEHIGPPGPPTFPAQPGLLLPVLTLVVVAALIARELVRQRMRRMVRDPEEFSISWLPTDAVALVRADYEELTSGHRPRQPRPQRSPFDD